MKWKNKHILIKAFTLVELQITLLLSGIVVSFVLMSYQIIFRFHKQYVAKVEQINKVQKLNFLLQKDNLQSVKINLTPNGFSFSNEKEKFVEYQPIENKLIRIQAIRRDTFVLENLSLQLLYNENEIKIVGDRINTIKIGFENDKLFHIKKEYASVQLMK